MRKSVQAMAMAGVALFVTSTAWAQSTETQTIVDRLDRLERDVRSLNVSVYRDGGGSPAPAASGASNRGGSAAYLSVRIGEIETEMRNLTGGLEQINFKIRKINERLDKLVGDVDYRLSALERGVVGGAAQGAVAQPGAPSQRPVPAAASTANPAQAPSASGTLGTLRTTTGQTPTGTVATTAPAPVEDPETIYKKARKKLLKQDWAGAEAGLNAFLATYPEDDLAPNARYWLGETYYVRQNYPRAIETFLQNYQLSPQSQKAPDSLLKLSMSLGAINKTAEACAALGKLMADYPKASPSVLSMAKRQRGAYGCP